MWSQWGKYCPPYSRDKPSSLGSIHMDTFPKSCELVGDLFGCSQGCMVEAGMFGCLSCIVLLSAEIACEGMIINKIRTRSIQGAALERPLPLPSDSS